VTGQSGTAIYKLTIDAEVPQNVSASELEKQPDEAAASASVDVRVEAV